MTDPIKTDTAEKAPETHSGGVLASKAGDGSEQDKVSILERLKRQIQAPQANHGQDIDLDRITYLASLGMPQHLIADSLGVSTSCFKKALAAEREESGPIYTAYKRGIGMQRVNVLESLAKGMEKSFIPAIFLAKQPHILGFQDVQQRQVSGEVKLVLEERVLHEPKQIKAVADDAEDGEIVSK